MARLLTFVFLFIVSYSSIAQAQPAEPSVGFITDDGAHQLTFDFGIEQWEQGKLTSHRVQQWFLQCSYPDPVTSQPSTSCWLYRTVIDRALTASSGDIISQQRHYSSDGTLKLLNIRWPNALDFTVVNTDRSTIEVMLRLTKKENNLYLDSFKATGIARGVFSNSLTAIDFKIPKYTYTLNVPVKMNGLRTREEKDWDDLLATMSNEDQKIWNNFRAAPPKECGTSLLLPEGDFINKISGGDPSRKAQIEKGARLTDAERVRWGNLLADDWAKCLKPSKISAAGQKKIVELLRKQLIPVP
jgi:hypothetical protein